MALPNFALGRLGNYEFCRVTDDNPMNMCFMQSSAPTASRDIWHPNTYVGDMAGNRGISGNGIEILLPSTNVVHYLPNGDVAAAAVIMDKAGTLGFAGDLPLEEGNALPFVGAAVAGATIYGPDGLPFVDVPDHPNFCCAPPDRRITRWVGASKSRLHPPRPFMLPIAYPTFGAPFALHDCEHKTTNVWIFEGDANQIHLSDFVDCLKWIRAMVVIRYMVGFFEAGVAAARSYVLSGHGDAALHARFERLNIDFDPAADQPVYSPRMASFMNTVKRRRLVGPALGRALVVVCQGLFCGGINNNDLFMNIVSYLPLSAHNFPFDWNADSRVNPLVQWNGVADVAKIAKLKTPDGLDVFPSSVAVARDIAAFFVARAAAHA